MDESYIQIHYFQVQYPHDFNNPEITHSRRICQVAPNVKTDWD